MYRAKIFEKTYSSCTTELFVNLIFCGACDPSKKNITVNAD